MFVGGFVDLFFAAHFRRNRGGSCSGKKVSFLKLPDENRGRLSDTLRNGWRASLLPPKTDGPEINPGRRPRAAAGTLCTQQEGDEEKTRMSPKPPREGKSEEETHREKGKEGEDSISLHSGNKSFFRAPRHQR